VTGSLHIARACSRGELRSAIDTHSVHTVLLVLVDMQGGCRAALLGPLLPGGGAPHGAERVITCSRGRGDDTVDGRADLLGAGLRDFELVRT